MLDSDATKLHSKPLLPAFLPSLITKVWESGLDREGHQSACLAEPGIPSPHARFMKEKK